MRTKLKNRHILSKSLSHLVLILTVLLFLYPFVYMVCTSFKSLQEIFKAGTKLLPKNVIIDNYKTVFTKLNIPLLIGNSLFVATLTTVVKLVTSVLAAYALVFIPNRRTNQLFYFFVITMFIPFSVIMLPNYLTISRLGLLNTLVGVVLPQLADATGIFRIRQAMRGVPKTLIEAAEIDRVPHMKALRKIVVPLIKPSVVSMGIFFFVNSWNEYFWPLLILTSNDKQTITLAMKTFTGSEGASGWGNVMALAAISVLLPLVLYLFAQRSIISTFMSSGIKE